jgi:hypothetical protein
MANTLKKIQTVTVGSGGAANIEFTSIPQTYTDLKLVVSGRGDFAGTREKYTLTFNNAATTYSYRRLAGYDSNLVLSDTGLGPQATGANTTASVFASAEFYIPNYTGSNQKSWSSDSVTENNSTSSWIVDLNAGLWTTTDAITSIKIVIQGPANFVQYSTATLYGVSNVPAAGNAKATGGIITYDDTYVYHTFPWSGTFTPLTSLTADYLVVAGGAGGGNAGGGGGGAGGLRCTVGATGGGGSLESALSLTANTGYTVTVGAGGAGATTDAKGTNGSNSVFSSITSTGGGGGGFKGSGNSGATGGSGGGGSELNSGGAGTANQGYAGGNGNTTAGAAGGGGGGANAVGANNANNSNGAAGGAGVATSISGTSTTYAGGGGGGGQSGTGGAGGSGGGGAGGSTTVNGTSATVNTGGGGGGGGSNTFKNGGAGGSGIVIVRYAR